MLRQKRRVAMTFPGADPAALADTGSRVRPGDLKVRVHGHRVTSRWPPESNFDSPPVFRGRLHSDGTGYEVTGTIRETTSRALMGWAYLALSLVGAALIVGAVLASVPGSARTVMIVVAVVLLAIFPALLIREFRLRRARFTREAAELETGLSSYVRTGATARPRP